MVSFLEDHLHFKLEKRQQVFWWMTLLWSNWPLLKNYQGDLQSTKVTERTIWQTPMWQRIWRKKQGYVEYQGLQGLQQTKPNLHQHIQHQKKNLTLLYMSWIFQKTHIFIGKSILRSSNGILILQNNSNQKKLFWHLLSKKER